MGILGTIAGFLGLTREEAAAADTRHASGGEGGRRGAAARGFSVQVPVAVERASLGTVLVPCDPGEGGVQGFRWYTRRLRIDGDGDVADEFLCEVVAEKASTENQTTPPKFQVKYNTRPVATAMRKQVIVAYGNIHQSLEYHGKLRWV